MSQAPNASALCAEVRTNVMFPCCAQASMESWLRHWLHHLVTHTIKMSNSQFKVFSPFQCQCRWLDCDGSYTFTVPPSAIVRGCCFLQWESWYLRGRLPRWQNESLLPGRKADRSKLVIMVEIEVERKRR